MYVTKREREREKERETEKERERERERERQRDRTCGLFPDLIDFQENPSTFLIFRWEFSPLLLPLPSPPPLPLPSNPSYD